MASTRHRGFLYQSYSIDLASIRLGQSILVWNELGHPKPIFNLIGKWFKTVLNKNSERSLREEAIAALNGFLNRFCR